MSGCGVRRTKIVKKENVLVAPRKLLEKRIYGEFKEFNKSNFEEILDDICFFFKNRPDAEADKSVKQFVTFTLFRHKNFVLIYKRGAYTTASETLKGAYSVGFGGHVNDNDFDLFNHGVDALLFNSSRELMEELYLDQEYSSVDEISACSTMHGFINVDCTDDAKQHIAALISCYHCFRLDCG